jgi:hypothetical protein
LYRWAVRFLAINRISYRKYLWVSSAAPQKKAETTTQIFPSSFCSNPFQYTIYQPYCLPIIYHLGCNALLFAAKTGKFVPLLAMKA